VERRGYLNLSGLGAKVKGKEINEMIESLENAGKSLQIPLGEEALPSCYTGGLCGLF